MVLGTAALCTGASLCFFLSVGSERSGPGDRDSRAAAGAGHWRDRNERLSELARSIETQSGPAAVEAANELLAHLDDSDAHVRAYAFSLAVGSMRRGAPADAPDRTLERMFESLGAPIEVRLAAETDEWLTWIPYLETLTAAKQTWCMLFYLEGAAAAEAAPYVEWALAQLGHSDPAVRARAVRTCRRIAPHAADLPDVLHAALDLGSPDEKVAAMQSVERLQEQIDLDSFVPRIVLLLSDSDSYVRRIAAITLGLLERVETIPALQALLADPICEVRTGAAYALVEIGVAEHVAVLIGVAKGDSSCDATDVADALARLEFVGDPAWKAIARQHVLGYPGGGVDPIVLFHALRMIEDAALVDAIPDIEPLLADESPAVQIEAATALHRLGSPSGLPILLQFMSATDEETRTRAIRSAARTKDEVFEAPLEALQGHESEVTRDAAVDALETLKDSGGG